MFKILRKLLNYNHKFDYISYWQERYSSDGNSGSGSYGLLADFKAEVINTFIKNHDIKSVIEFGCGDGNQIKLMNYEKYLGLDVAKSSIDKCLFLFNNDHSKNFILYNPKYFINYNYLQAELVVCLDVLYHIIDENDFLKTLYDIFSCSSKWVILYTTLEAYKSEPHISNSHIFHRDILSYLSKFEEFKIEKIIRQKYKESSSADFIIIKLKENMKSVCCDNITNGVNIDAKY